MKGPRIARVQRLLQRQGRPIRIDALYGKETAAAVRWFQRYRGFDADGVAGPITERAIRPNAGAPKFVRHLSLRYPSLNGSDVMPVQKALRRSGHRLTVDGHYGPARDMAVARFQELRDLDPHGMIGSTDVEGAHGSGVTALISPSWL
ncbi:MAG: peptidoglycan-binding protein [Nitrospira sp.]|nr:peptidoglycan-binding protein [Nitrospira sp.]MDH4303424.1 peptidoglycan-binding protein [Nitrospira sp.]MDH5192101.1 peptidoglycan-binding protein [Nitrospira sp.]